MAKKRKIKRARMKKIKPSNGAHVLVIIALVILVLNGIISTFFTDWLINMAESSLGVTVNKSAVITYGITWFLLAIFALIANNKIRENFKAKQLEDQSWIWFLLVISIVTIFIGRIDSGILLMIASIVYLAKVRKLLNKN